MVGIVHLEEAPGDSMQLANANKAGTRLVHHLSVQVPTRKYALRAAVVHVGHEVDGYRI